jgi:putative oxidoreductase
MQLAQNTCLLLGRFLMGAYFVLPGLQKIFQYEVMTNYMLAQNVPATAILLPITILLQITLGLAIIVGFKGQISAFILAGLTLVISIYMHNFWAMEEGVQRVHEMQNFIKNMAIMSGLLMVSSIGTGRFSLDNRSAKSGV